MIDQAVERAKSAKGGARPTVSGSRRSDHVQKRTESRLDKRGRREESEEEAGMESGRRY